METSGEGALVAKRVAVGIAAFILNLIAADLVPPSLNGFAYWLLRPLFAPGRLVERELLISVFCAAIVALCVTQFWSTRTARSIWILSTSVLVVRMVFYAAGHNHNGLMPPEDSMWRHFFHPQISSGSLDPSTFLDFFVVTIGAVRCGTYSLVAWASERWRRTPLQASSPPPSSDRPELKIPVLWPASGWFTATNLLIGINVAVFAAMTAAGGSMFVRGTGQLVQWGDLAGWLTEYGEGWRLVTHQFVHLNIFHLAANMMCLWWIGRLAEKIFGSGFLIAISLLTGVAAGLATIAWNPIRVTVGASGGIMGIAGALIVVMLYGRLHLPANEFFWRRICVFVLYTALSGFSPFVDNIAHVAGFVSGILLGLIYAIGLRGGNPHRIFLPARLFQGREAIDKQDWKSATEYLLLCIEVDPKRAAPHALLGYTFDVQQRFDQAAEEYQQALGLGCTDPAIAANLAAIAERKSEAAGAP